MAMSRLLLFTKPPIPGGTRIAFWSIPAKCCSKNVNKEASRSWLGSCSPSACGQTQIPFTCIPGTISKGRDRSQFSGGRK